MNQKLRRSISALLASMVGMMSSLSGLSINFEVTDIFTFQTNSKGQAVITGMVDNYKDLLAGVTEITLPETYNGMQCILNSTTFQDNTYFTKIVVPESYDKVSGFKNCTSIKTIELLNENEISFSLSSLSNCTSLEELKIYADSISGTPSASIFKNVPSTAVVYVKNDSVKGSLVNWPGTFIVDANMGGTSSGGDDSSQTETPTIDKTELASKISEAEAFLAGIDTSKYNNIIALEKAILNAKSVYESSTSTQDDVNNSIDALNTTINNVEKIVDKTALGNKITEVENFLSGIDKALYTGIKALQTELGPAKIIFNKETATQTEVDNKVTALTSALNNVSLANTNKVALASEINAGENFKKNKTDADYDNFNKFTSALNSAKIVYNNGDATQDEINEACANLIAAQASVTKKDASDLITELNGLIGQVEALNKNDYTVDSWSVMEIALTEAKEKVKTDDMLRSQYNYSIVQLKTAMTGLEIKPQNLEEPGEPIAKINKNAVETNLGTFTADENTAGTSKIRITFDCAGDVSFNQYASIEVKATVNGTESYQKFTGTDTTETAGAKGFSVELPLKNAVNAGDEISLVAYTWAWANASDYVYGITKIEYLNSVGQIVKAVTDRTIALDELKTAIAEAEKIESSNYTEDSFAELTNAITAAKDLPDDSAKSDIEAAKTTLANAVAGLIENTEDSSSEPESKPDSESSSETESKPDSESSSDTESKPDSSSKTDESSKTDDNSGTESNSSSSSKTDSGSANSNSNSSTNSTAKGTNPAGSNPNTGAKSAAVAGVLIIAAIGVIASRKK